MTTDQPTVTVDTVDAVSVVTVCNPPHNLLTEALLRAVADALHDVGPGVRVIVLSSVGRSFCAGANFRSGDAPDPTEGDSFAVRTGAFYAQAARVFASPVPVGAAIQGAAIGAGFGLALACDMRVVSEAGWFQANFVRLGIHPGFALSMTLPHFVGPGRAADLLLTGRRVEATEALHMGLADKVVPAGTELAEARAVAETIAQGAPLAVKSTRATLRADLAARAKEAMRHELSEQSALAGGADALEGVAAMLEGRPPRFSGR